jgi:hypothetical protein
MKIVRYTTAVVIFLALMATAGMALAQGSTSMWYIGPFEGEVTVKDGQTPGQPGYYYRPQATEYPTFAERYDHPVRCGRCGLWRDLGDACPRCGLAADPYERSQARQGTVYSPYPIPGQYWYDKPMRSMTGPKVGMGYPYLGSRYR